MSKFIVYDRNRQPAGLLQNDISVIWQDNYQSPGEVKITARATADNLALLVDGNRIYNKDCSTSARIVQAEIIEDGAEAVLEVRAKMTSSLLDDRVVMATEVVQNVEEGMYAIYSKNRRDLPIDVAPPQGYTETTETEVAWNTVLDAFLTLSQASGLGYSVDFDAEAGTETLRVYKGVDRTDILTDQYVGYLGPDAENVHNVRVVTGSSVFKNAAIVVGGEGEFEDDPPYIRTVSLGTVAGEERRELYVDAKDLKHEHTEALFTGDYDENGNPIYEQEKNFYTDDEYKAVLDSRGREKLEESLKDFSVSCDVEQSAIRFGEDYGLGDRLPIKLPSMGVAASAVVSSVQMVYESGGQDIEVTLSDFRMEGSNE